MRKHIIRVLIVMFAACLGLAVFAGCTNEGEKQTYTVSYAAGGGTGTAPSAETYEEGATFKVKENPFTYEGHTFKTWNDGTKDVAAGSDYTMPAKNVTFTAKWEDNSAEQVTVTFSLGDYKEGTAPQAQKVKKGGDVTLPTPPTWEGHTFLGWKIGDDAALKQAGLKVAVNADVTVTAQWELAKEQVTVSFDLGGVEPLNKDKPETAWATPEAVKTNKDEEYTLPFAPAWWAGHMFTGWKVDDGAVKKAGEKITPSANVKLTAQWKEEQSITGATLDVDNDAVYVVISGQYEGYTDAAMLDALENCNQRVLCISVCLNHSPYDYQELDIQFEAEEGIYTATIDVTGLEKDGYSICECINSYGDVKSVTCDVTETLNNVKYQLSGSVGHNLTLTISDASKEYAFTSMKLEAETDKVYLTIGGTFSGYTADEFKGLLEDTDKNVLFVDLCHSSTWAWQGLSTTVTATSGTFEIKIDVTSLEVAIFSICENQGGSGDIPWNDAFAATVTLGDKSYTIERQWAGNTQINVKATSTPTPPAYTFERPSSAKLELMNDKGNGTDENFENEIERAFFVISGTYTGEVTEEIAKDYFKKDNYPFEFGIYNSTKDRIRRISIDTAEHTYTVKFDVTWLPAGEHICRFGPAGGTDDLKLSLEACPDSSVKSVGSTFTLTNYYGQEGAAGHWGCIYLKIERNYTFTNVKLEDTEDVPYLVIEGTFETEKFSAEEIEKFLKDEDVRSMCVDLNKDGWKNMTTVVTTGDGTFTVKMDLSSLEIANGYLVCTDCSGYGDIKTEHTGTITVGGKIYTFGKDTYGNLTIDVTEAPVEKTFTPTEVTLEVAEDSSKVYVVIKANVTGYSEEDLQTMVYIGEVEDMTITVGSVSIADGVATLKFDFTGASTAHWWWGHYTIGEGDQTDLRVTVTEVKEYVGEYSYRLFNQDGMTIVEIKQEAKPAGTITFTGADLVKEGDKVYLVVTATFTGYTQEELNAFVYVGETDKDPNMKFTVETATIEGDTVTLKFDFTGRVSSNWWWANYSIGEDTGRINCTFTDETITSGDYKYELKHNNSDQVIVVISNAE